MLLTQSLATQGSCVVMFLDLIGAFDEVMRTSIQAMADLADPEVTAIVAELLAVYDRFQAHVVTAFGVSNPYVQVEGVLQGGGLDPLFYVMAMHTLHLAVKQTGLGVPLVTTDRVEAVGSLGYVDDTAAMAADGSAAQEMADKIRAVFDVLGQRNHSGKMVVLSLIMSPEEAVCSRRVSVRWGADIVKTVDRYKHVKFLGRNANPIGGFTYLKKMALKWSGVIIAKLMIWPPSYRVAKAVIEGLRMNRLVGRVVVTIPPDPQLSSIEASVARTYRVVFGLPYHTPSVFFGWLGRPVF